MAKARRDAAADFYAVLGVPRTATDVELRSAYKRQALRYHPDKNRGNVEEATERFKLVAEAYSVLKDPASRAAYDRGSASEAPGPGFTFEKATDLFSDVFGPEFVDALTWAAKGIAGAPGTVLAAAKKRCPELPGVRKAVSAGYESMVAEAELDLTAQIQSLAAFDVCVDEALCRVDMHAEYCRKTALERQRSRAHCAQRATAAMSWCVGAIVVCCAMFFAEATYLLAVFVIPSAFLSYRMVACYLELSSQAAAHKRDALIEQEAQAKLKHRLRQARASLEDQRKRVAASKEELARTRGFACDCEQHGPSLADALTVSSHFVSQVVSSAVTTAFRRSAHSL
mmetsp:Transcript_58793/g.164130  ORF Transcript_58793/g.164130 Transcript_58793/m.164130 type:complete len:341 (-) Transcript_58793:274-1296(-)